MTNLSKILKTGLLASALILPSMVATAGDVGDHIKAAISSDTRTSDKVQYDDRRKPGKMLSFAGVEPGMTVLDINSGGGYYSEILSGAVGDKGKVIAHNGAIYWSFMKGISPEGLAGRGNVTEIHNGREVVDLPEASVDVVLCVLAYHDYFFAHAEATGESVADINASVYKALKPGGILLVVDHVGSKGATNEDISKIHRIDPMRVRAELEAAGFEFAGESDALRNPDNSPDTPWFGAKPRYNSDRFAYKFVKK